MPPNIALALCILLITYVFVLDFKQKSDLSSALWVPLIWMIISGSRPVSYWLSGESVVGTEIDYTAGDPISRVCLLILIFAGIFILSKRKIEWPEILKSNSWIITLYLYMAISIIWSDFPQVSFKRWIRAIGDIIMVLVVLTDHDPLEAIKRMFRRFAYVIIPFSIICNKYFPSIGVSYSSSGIAMWSGVTTHKNALGLVSCVSASFFLWELMPPRRRDSLIIDIVLLAMSLYLLFSGKNYSATAIVIFFIGIGTFIVLSKSKSNPEHLTRNLVLIILPFLFIITFAYEFIFPFITSATGRDMTLTGRTDIWRELIPIGSLSSILGTGYGGFWIGNLTHDLWDKFGGAPTQAHCGYLDVWLQLGWVGLTILVLLIFFTYKILIKDFKYNFEFCRLRITLFTMILIHNITETSLLRGANFFWFLFLLVILNTPRREPLPTISTA